MKIIDYCNIVSIFEDNNESIKIYTLLIADSVFENNASVVCESAILY